MSAGFDAVHWLVLVQNELLLFSATFFALGALDEVAVDLLWLWGKLTGRIRTHRIDREALPRTLAGRAAVLIPAWREEKVIAITIAHLLDAWPQAELTLFVGCYRNDDATMAAVAGAVRSDPRIRLVVHEADGPTTKADCLNRLYRAVSLEEERHDFRFRLVMLQDAEDMVDPAALALADAAIDHADFVQFPVLPQPQPKSRWIGGHYPSLQSPFAFQRFTGAVFPRALSFPVLPSFFASTLPCSRGRSSAGIVSFRSAPA